MTETLEALLTLPVHEINPHFKPLTAMSEIGAMCVVVLEMACKLMR